MIWIHKFTSNFIHKLIVSCPNLKFLKFSYCIQLNDEMIIPLEKLAKLEEFYLERTEFITDVGFQKMLLGSNTILQKLSILDCKNVTDKSLKKIFFSCINLNFISLRNLEQITDESIFSLMEYINYKNLTYLNIDRCNHLSDSSFTEFFLKCGKNIQILQLRGLGNISFKTFQSISRFCLELKELDLSWSRNIDDKNLIDHIITHCKKLKKITLWGCNKITDIGVFTILKKGIEVIGKYLFKF